MHISPSPFSHTARNGFLLGITLKLSHFNVKMLTMHRWFNITAAETDLGYAPIVSFADGWPDTLTWFKENWLPSFDERAGLTGLHKDTEAKIATQVAGTGQAAAKAKAE